MGSEMTQLKFQLNTGNFIPALGLGTVNVFTSSGDLEVVKNAVLSALKVGYRHIDTASRYNSEIAVGNALQEAFRGGLLEREDVYVTTKVWADKLTPDGVLESTQTSLRNLQLQYVDSLLMHMPVRIRPGAQFHELSEEDFLPLDLRSVWGAFERTQDLGLTKAVGVSNFCVKRLQELLNYAKVVPAVNQVEIHPYCNQAKLRAFCYKKGIHATGWAPLMAPNTFYGSGSVFDDPILRGIAKKHGKSVPQICLRWCVEMDCSTVPKSFSEGRQIENLSIFDFKLTEEDHERISNLPQRKCHHDRDRNDLRGQYMVFDDQWDDNE